MPQNLLYILKPLTSLIPTTTSPHHPLTPYQKIKYTSLVLFIYLICSQLPLYGVIRTTNTHSNNHWARIITGSSKYTLMQLGLSPIIFSSWCFKLFNLIGLTQTTTPETIELQCQLQRTFTMLFSLTTTIIEFVQGQFGPLQDHNVYTVGLIIIQLMIATLLMLMMDDMLKNGYGLGSGIALYIVANFSVKIVWGLFSPVFIKHPQNGLQFQGIFIQLIHTLLTTPNKLHSLYHCYTRNHPNNLHSYLIFFLVFLILIYLNRFHHKLSFHHQHHPSQHKTIKIKLFSHSIIISIIQSILISRLYEICSILCTFLPTWLEQYIGIWEQDVLSGGFLWYISPPRSFGESFVRMGCYMIFVCLLGMVVAMQVWVLCRIWAYVENDAPEDIAKRVLMDGLVPEEEGMSVYGLVRQDANVAVKLGACIIGVLNVITEIADTAGSGTTMLLSISILMKYYDQLA